MSIYRVYTYDPPGSSFYSANGNLYNTGRFDSSQALGQGCTGDAQGFQDFPSLLAYANQRGETLRGPVTRDFVNALCGGLVTIDGTAITAGPGSPTPSGGGTGGTGGSCSGASCGPAGPIAVTLAPAQPSPTQTPPSGGVSATAPNVTVNVPPSPSSTYIGTPSPTSGSLSVSLNVPPALGTPPSPGTGVSPSITPQPKTAAGFDFVTFFKSPFGILILVLLVIILLTRHGA